MSLVMMLLFAYAIGVKPDSSDPGAEKVAAATTGDKLVTSIQFTSPPSSRVGVNYIIVDQGATGIPLTVTSKVNDPADTIRVRYTYGSGQTGFSRLAPYPFTIPDLTTLSSTSTLTAAASSYTRYAANNAVEVFTPTSATTLEIVSASVLKNPVGVPSSLFDMVSLLLQQQGLASYYSVSTIGGTSKAVVLTLLPDPATKGLDEVDEGGTTISAADPDNPDRIYSVTIPDGVILDGEVGMAMLQVTSTLEALVGATGTDNVVTAQPAGGLVGNASFAEFTLFVSDDGGATLSVIDDARLVDNPIEVNIQGSDAVAGENLSVFSYPTDVVLAPSTDITAAPAGVWTKAQGGTLVEDGTVTGSFTSNSIFAPFLTPNDLNIVSIINMGTSSLAGTAREFAPGGSDIYVRVANATGATLGIEIDGVDVSAGAMQMTDGAIEIVGVSAPAAAALASPAPSAGVSVRVFEAVVKGDPGDTSDTVPNGLTYVAPVIDSVTPNVGLDSGGTGVTVAGEGFATGLSASIGGAAMTGIVVGSEASFSGTTSSADPGLADLVVTTANNFVATAEGAFTYEPSPPTITSVFPDTVYDDGGYTVRVTGTNFLDPETTFKGAVQSYGAYVYNYAYFTLTPDVANPALDDKSPFVRFLDDTRLNVLTPVRSALGMYNLYVANAVYQSYGPSKQLDNFFSMSNLVDFTFLDINTAPFSISSIVPDSGPKSGGTSVEITGVGFPEAKAADGSKGTTGFNGHTIQMISQAAPNGQQIALELYYIRGDDLGETDAAPSSMSFRFSYDPSVLTPVLVSGQPANQESANLTNFYGKSIDTAAPESGVVSVVISGGTTGITTCDDEIVDPFNPDAHDPNDCQNPFLLGRVLFNSVGAADAVSTLALSQLSMADSGANPLTNINTVDGQFCVAATPCEIVEPSVAVDVFFGPEMATPTKFVSKQTSASITVAAPRAFPDMDPLFDDDSLFPDAGFGVDVLVRDQADADMFAISKAASLYNPSPPTGNRGYIYLNEVPPSIDMVSPGTGWLFGGAVMTITGQGFSEAKAVTVTIGGVEAAPAPGMTQSDTERNVIIPPLDTTSTDQSIAVDVTVTVTADAKAVGSDTAEDAFTYVRYEAFSETVDMTTASVTSNAFYFEGGTGGAFDLVFNVADKQNTNTISTGGGSIEIPALPAEALKGTSGLVFGMLRAAKNTDVIGTENLDDVGDGITNIWKFDLHLYDGQYPFAELTGIRFNTDETPITLSFPTDDADLTEAELKTGGVSNWSVEGGVYDYTYGNPDYTPADGTPTYEATVIQPQSTIKDGYVTEITGVKLYQATQAAFSVLRNAYPPASLVNCAIADGSPTSGPNAGGTNIELSGDNIAWTNRVLFVPATKQGDATSVPTNRGLDANLLEVTTPASPTGGQVTTDLFLDITTNTAGKGGTTTLIPVQGQFQFTGGGIRFPFGALLAALLALLGLLAGGDSGGGGGGPCFIATAAYGTTMVEQVDTLRTVRDTVLLDNAFGTAFVDAYYRVSPAVADVVAQSPALAAAVRMVLVPVIALAKLVLAVPHVSLGLLSLAFLAMVMRRRIAKARKA